MLENYTQGGAERALDARFSGWQLAGPAARALTS